MLTLVWANSSSPYPAQEKRSGQGLPQDVPPGFSDPSNIHNHLLISSITPSRSGPSNLFSSHSCIVYYFLNHLVTVHSLNMAYPSKTNHFNISNNILTSKLLIVSQPLLSSFLDGPIYLPYNLSFWDRKFLITLSVKTYISLTHINTSLKGLFLLATFPQCGRAVTHICLLICGHDVESICRLWPTFRCSSTTIKLSWIGLNLWLTTQRRATPLS